MSIHHVALKDLEPNPYRHIEKYQYDEEKLERLQASYHESGFWDGSIQARPHPTKDAKYQLAFGHHRVRAAKSAGMDTVGVVVSPRDNSTMLRMMASENAEEFKHSPLVTQETIGAVIEAYGAGEIELEPVSPDTRKSDIYVVADATTYSLPTVAKFLGWLQRDGRPTRNCRIAFEAWHAEHDLGIDVDRLQRELQRDTDAPETLSNKAVEAVLTAAKTARKEAIAAEASPAVVKEAAQAAAREVTTAIKKKGSARATKDKAGQLGKESARRVLRRRGIRDDKVQTLPTFVLKTVDMITDRSLRFLADIQERVTEALPYREQVPDQLSRDLVRVLRKQAKEAHDTLTKLADTWEHHGLKNVTPKMRRLAR